MSSRPFLQFSELVPSEDWELNVLLLDIAKQLDSEEFDKLKFLCTGSNGVPKGVLSRLTSPEMFFTYFRERAMISRDNLLLLQAFLWHLDRKDLHGLAAEYAQKIGNALHFYAPKDEPEDGFKHVQFHVEGNLDRFQRSDLEALRSTMARLLFVPQEFIFLSGVEPSGTLTLTFMIHERFVTPLKTLFRDHKDSFGQLGVDGISVDNKEFIDPSLRFRRRHASAPSGKVTQCQLCALYQRILRLQSQVTQSEIRSLESKADADLARQEVLEWRRKESYFRSLLARIVENDGHETELTSSSLTLV